MELNSTQETTAGDAAPTQPDTAGTYAVPRQQGKPVPDKKTTIQLFTSTTARLTQHKHGNDTYDDVVNRHAEFFEKNGGTATGGK